MQRLAASHAAETTVSVVQLPSRRHEGPHHRPRGAQHPRAGEPHRRRLHHRRHAQRRRALSAFDGVRREVARMTLEKLLQDGRIHPARIEETYYQAKSELESPHRRAGRGGRLRGQRPGPRPRADQAPRPPALPHLLRPERPRPLGRVRAAGGDDGRRARRQREDRAPRRAAARHRQGRLARDRGPARARRRRPRAPPRRARGRRARDGGPPQRGRAPDRRGRHRPGRRRALRRAARAPAASRSSSTSSACATSSRSPRATRASTRSTRCRPGREIRVIVAPDAHRRRRRDPALAATIAREIEKELEYPGQIKVTVIRESRAVDYAK